MLFAAAFKLGCFLSFFVVSTTDYLDVCTDDRVSKYLIGELQEPLKPNLPVKFSMEDLLSQIEQLKFLEDEEDVTLERREKLLLNQDLFEGDILLYSSHTLRKILNQDDGPSRLDGYYTNPWPDKTVPFAFQDDFTITQQLRIVLAMNRIQRASCVKFKIRTNERAYLQFYKSPWCASHVGYQGRVQGLAISDECLRSNTTILHLLMHTLGFWHEHTRADRHQHICIQWTNIQPEYWCNFRQFRSLPHKPLPYDHLSILHIPTMAFATNKEKPVYTINMPWEIHASSGENNELSQIDTKRILDKYECYTDFSQRPVISFKSDDYSPLNSWNFSQNFPFELSGRFASNTEDKDQKENIQSSHTSPQTKKSSPESSKPSSISPLFVKQRSMPLPQVKHETATSRSHLLQYELQIQLLCSLILIFARDMNRFFNLA